MNRVVVELYGWGGEKVARVTIEANPQGRFRNPEWDPNVVREWRIVGVGWE